MEEDDPPTVVFDNGSKNTRVGFGGEDAPRNSFPSVVGHLRHIAPLVSPDMKYQYVGDEAQVKRGILHMRYPIHNGVITDWDDMERIWHHSFYNELRVAPEEHPVIVSEAPLNPKKQREWSTTTMFEVFNLPAVYFASTAVLSLYACGKTTGLVVDCGDTGTRIVPVYEGHVLEHAVEQLSFGGREITRHLTKILDDSGFHILTPIQAMEVVGDIKEKHCFVSLNFEREIENVTAHVSLERIHETVCGSKVTLSSERFRSPEGLFQPSIFGIEGEGVHQAVLNSLQKCDPEIKNLMSSNIVLSGGSTHLPGFGDRLKKELVAIIDPPLEVNVTSASQTLFPSWTGASIFSSLPFFRQTRISKQEYDESGTVVVHRMCL